MRGGKTGKIFPRFSPSQTAQIVRIKLIQAIAEQRVKFAKQ